MASRTSSRKKKTGGRGRAASTRRGSRAGSASDATRLLEADHGRVKAMFQRFEKARGQEQKGKLASEICSELTVHALIEEEIFYPAARQALEGEDSELLDEAKVEHDSAKELISQIEAAGGGDELFEAKVKVLGEYVNHHVEEEEGELFPRLRRTDLDLVELGRQLKQRKQELQARGANGGRRRSQPFTDSPQAAG